MVLVIHIKVEETSEVFKRLTIFNRSYDFTVDQKLWLKLKRAGRQLFYPESGAFLHREFFYYSDLSNVLKHRLNHRGL